MNKLIKATSGTITSLELLKEINFFRDEIEGKAKLRHDTLLGIIRDEFEEEIGSQEILESSYKNTQNKELPMFVLTTSQAKQVLVRESKVVRKAVIAHIEKLESALISGGKLDKETRLKYITRANARQLPYVLQELEIEPIEEKPKTVKPKKSETVDERPMIQRFVDDCLVYASDKRIQWRDYNKSGEANLKDVFDNWREKNNLTRISTHVAAKEFQEIGLILSEYVPNSSIRTGGNKKYLWGYALKDSVMQPKHLRTVK